LLLPGRVLEHGICAAIVASQDQVGLKGGFGGGVEEIHPHFIHITSLFCTLQVFVENDNWIEEERKELKALEKGIENRTRQYNELCVTADETDASCDNRNHTIYKMSEFFFR